MDDADLMLLVDDEEWRAIGAELRRVDPKRYVELLKVARDIVDIHRDPIAPTRTQLADARHPARARDRGGN